MQLNRIDDPRDALAKARRSELVEFARANGVTEIVPDMPAILMRDILRRRGLTRIRIPNRPLGASNTNHPVPEPSQPASSVEADATADLARQWQMQQAQQPPAREPVAVANMTINELRNECKRLGIKLERRDNMKSMREKIEAKSG